MDTLAEGMHKAYMGKMEGMSGQGGNYKPENSLDVVPQAR